MANFPTHIVVGTIVAGSLATLTLAADVIAPENLVAVTMAGSLGSVLPDIDLKDSRPSRALFAGLAVFFSFALLFHFAPHLSIVEMWTLWLGTLLFVRYGLHTMFHRLATHRGVWHSWIAGIACAFATVLIFYYVFDRPDGVAWLAGGFLLVGFLTHLILDEMYSVDVLGNHIKKSFGTAFKPIDMRNPAGSAAMAVAAVVLLLLTPSISVFYDGHYLAADVGVAASAAAAAGSLVRRGDRPPGCHDARRPPGPRCRRPRARCLHRRPTRRPNRRRHSLLPCQPAAPPTGASPVPGSASASRRGRWR